MTYSKASGAYSFSAAGGNGQAYGATGYGAVAIGGSTNARADNSVALGASAYTQTGAQSVAIGDSYASGSHSLAAAISTNTSSYGATGDNSIAIGKQCKATSGESLAMGANSIASSSNAIAIGNTNTASGASGATVVGGYVNTASGNKSFVFGAVSTASADNAMVLGERGVANTIGKLARASGGFAAVAGTAQAGTFVLRSDTTDGTAEALTTNLSTASTANQVILPNNSAYSFSGTIIARESAAAGSDYASWEIKGALLRDANAASTVLGNGIKNKTVCLGWCLCVGHCSYG